MNISTFMISLFFVTLTMAAEVIDYPTTLYTFPTEFEPAFCSLLYNPDTGGYDLAYSSFTGIPDEPDRVLRVSTVSQNYLDKTKMQSQLITDEILWPNEIGQVPYGAFGSSNYWTSASAFFLPEKDNGSISLIDMTDPLNPGKPIWISSEQGKEWYYHRVLWHDMDYDGDYDAVTARAYGNEVVATEAELVWFENPGINPPPEHWETHVIISGYEDVGLRIENLPLPDGSETLVIFSSGFFSQSLTLTWTTDGDWKNSASIQHRVIDDAGWYFDLQVADLNVDGKKDILVTTWARPNLDAHGSLLAYEMPDGDWRTENWIKQVLTTDFRDVYLFPGNGAPGSPIPFWRSKAMELNGEKPHIILSGDDDGHAYLLVPNSEDPLDWTYKKSTIFRALGTVGTIAVGDIDGDGYTEMFIPGYSTNQIVVMTYKP
uniref:uncharacterized protein LOC120331605 n=1 Tax=Styela clava TaxID=7725 RepID=UPI001939E19B|nr:uncharacterized protein LOC120331605 [Styela clava]